MKRDRGKERAGTADNKDKRRRSLWQMKGGFSMHDFTSLYFCVFWYWQSSFNKPVLWEINPPGGVFFLFLKLFLIKCSHLILSLLYALPMFSILASITVSYNRFKFEFKKSYDQLEKPVNNIIDFAEKCKKKSVKFEKIHFWMFFSEG